MEEILRFSNQPLRNEEYFRHKSEILQVITQSEMEPILINTVATPFKSSVDEIRQALEVISKNAYTQPILDADDERDCITSGLFDMINGLTKHFDAEKRRQAVELQIISNHYKGINRQSIESQTGSTENLLQNLNEKKEYLENLKITEWVTQLETINKKVADLIMNRFEENVSKPVQRMKEERPICNQRLEALYKVIEAIAIMSPDEKVSKCISLINNINKNYMDIIAQRRGIAAAKKEKEAQVE